MTDDSKLVKPAGRPKPPNAGKGRKKGVPNKTTKALKEMILQALETKGGDKYLERQADENPVAFMTLLGKVLPLQVNAEHELGPRAAKALRWLPPTKS